MLELYIGPNNVVCFIEDFASSKMKVLWCTQIGSEFFTYHLDNILYNTCITVWFGDGRRHPASGSLYTYTIKDRKGS